MILLSYGFRTFFTLAGPWAALALGAWLARLHGWAWPGAPADALGWHVHEMLYGFVGAAMAGFLLTAIPNFTGREPVRGAPLAALALAWLVGRVAMASAGVLPAELVALLELTFPVGLALVVARELGAARNRRNYPLAVIVALFALADLGFHAAALGWAPGHLLYGLALHLVLLLVVVLGGRITPAFTRNWLAARGETRLPVSRAWLDRAALALTAAVGLAAVLAPGSPLLAVLAAATALAHAVRLAGWRGLATVREPLLLVLHAGLAWLVVGYALLALAAAGLLPLGAALHALSAGGIGTMVLGVSSRVALGHTGRALHASPAVTLAYLLLGLGAALRVASAFAGGAYLQMVTAGGLLWVAAWALFCVVYLPILAGPRVGG